MHPVLAKALSKDHFKATVTLSFKVALETERIGVSECEGVYYVFLWVLTRTGESILGETAVVDFECDCVVQCILILEIHLAQFR